MSWRERGSAAVICYLSNSLENNALNRWMTRKHPENDNPSVQDVRELAGSGCWQSQSLFSALFGCGCPTQLSCWAKSKHPVVRRIFFAALDSSTTLRMTRRILNFTDYSKSGVGVPPAIINYYSLLIPLKFACAGRVLAENKGFCRTNCKISHFLANF